MLLNNKKLECPTKARSLPDNMFTTKRLSFVDLQVASTIVVLGPLHKRKPATLTLKLGAAKNHIRSYQVSYGN